MAWRICVSSNVTGAFEGHGRFSTGFAEVPLECRGIVFVFWVGDEGYGLSPPCGESYIFCAFFV
ncbi:expressed unknown protein [Ectocarpus siliculosus]|uniref:Uncharacterized protein n=1 Tax=Ectocarpus siliculosus TaxID=2880 RepID=D8LQQ7_ECTSI|nr:expressed unknown protein [Ectocarpus siliculosus]|eukprot:CBN74934.1 expressed unknown protein [Ectocarpus siliculosus]